MLYNIDLVTLLNLNYINGLFLISTNVRRTIHSDSTLFSSRISLKNPYNICGALFLFGPVWFARNKMPSTDWVFLVPALLRSYVVNC